MSKFSNRQKGVSASFDEDSTDLHNFQGNHFLGTVTMYQPVYTVLTDLFSICHWCVLRQKLIQVAKSFCKLQKANKLWFRSLSLLEEDKRKAFWYAPSQKPCSFDCHKQGKVIWKLNRAEQCFNFVNNITLTMYFIDCLWNTIPKSYYS